MTKIDLLNAAAAIVALSTSLAVMSPLGGRGAYDADSSQKGEASAASLEDATGTRVDLMPFRRIVSASAVADRLLFELCEPDRVVAFTSYGARESYRRHLYAGKPTIDDLSDVEAILALRPDLVLVNNVAEPKRVARLREAGVVVFDLGPMRGVSSLEANIVTVGKLLGAPDRGEALRIAFRRRIERVAQGMEASSRRKGLYVGIHGGRLFGGTRGTSYGDILRFAGVDDVAAETYRDWPEYTSEQVLLLDPELLVTYRGMGAALCRHPGLSRLRACSAGEVVEMDERLLGDPGLEMLEAAEVLNALVYEAPDAGARASRERPPDGER